MTDAVLCRASDAVLVLIDVQERLAAAMPEAALGAMTAAAGNLLEGAGQLDVPVIATEQYPAGLGATLPALRERLPAGHRLLDKTCFSCRGAEGFDPALAALQRRQVVLAGMETHICVLQTALQLQAGGYGVFVVEDAVCARSADRSRNGLQRMRQAGVVICHSESVLFEWLGDARHEKFKALSALLK